MNQNPGKELRKTEFGDSGLRIPYIGTEYIFQDMRLSWNVKR